MLRILRSAALRSFLVISSTARRRQSAGSTVAVVEQLERGRGRSGGMEEGFVESLDERDELVAGRNAVRLRFAGQGGVGRRVARLLQRPDLGTIRNDDQRQKVCCNTLLVDLAFILIHCTHDNLQMLETPCTQVGGQPEGRKRATFTHPMSVKVKICTYGTKVEIKTTASQGLRNI